MLVIISSILSIFMIVMALFTLILFLSKKTKNWNVKWSPFECGFNFFNKSRVPFSMRFFLIAIIFIIFDVEISILFPMIPTFTMIFYKKWFFSITSFMLIIILGILLEWKEMSFEWKK